MQWTSWLSDLLLCRKKFFRLLGELILIVIIQRVMGMQCSVRYQVGRIRVVRAAIETLLNVVRSLNICRSLLAAIEREGDWNQYLIYK